MSNSKVGKGNKAVGVILPLDIYDLLKVWAKKRDWSVSQAARNIIADVVSAEGDEADQPTKE
ncbi:MAG TPA: hypothetical protein V6D48_22925 [Oculatellaceae cyanobacterium]